MAAIFARSWCASAQDPGSDVCRIAAMGTDIHAMIERRVGKPPHDYWLNAGDPDIHRNYCLFTALAAGIRPPSTDDPPTIVPPRGVPDDACSTMKVWHEYYGHWCGTSPHSASLVTLAEMKALRDAGKADHQDVQDTWVRLIAQMETIRPAGGTDADVRLVYFFDN
jgi:hypothetical protein